MRILVIGATGLIGNAIVEALGQQHEVVAASRTSASHQVNIDDPASIQRLMAAVGTVDAIVCAAGQAAFRPVTELTDADFQLSIRSKLLGQVDVFRFGLAALSDGGSVTLTSGQLAQHPIPGSAAVSLVNAGLEGFVRAAALEAPRRTRVNVVSPGWVTETLLKFGMDPAAGVPASDVAQLYVRAVSENVTGQVIAAQ